jgi:hypothetical protein
MYVFNKLDQIIELNIHFYEKIGLNATTKSYHSSQLTNLEVTVHYKISGKKQPYSLIKL